MKLVCLLPLLLWCGATLSAQDLYLDWVSEIKGVPEDQYTAIAVGPNDHISVAGRSSYGGSQLVHRDTTMSFAPGPTWRASRVQHHDADGRLLWVKRFLGGRITDVHLDQWGHTYVLGNFADSLDLDPGAGTEMAYATHRSRIQEENVVMLVKLDANGDYLWGKTFPATRAVHAQWLRLDGKGNCYLAGTFRHELDADPGPGVTLLENGRSSTTTNVLDFFVIKLNDTGRFLWAFDVANPADLTTGFGAKLDGFELDADGFYLVGRTTRPIDLSPDTAVQAVLTPVGRYENIFVGRYDLSGGLRWSTKLGDGVYCTLQSVGQAGDGALLLSGHVVDSVDFDPGPPLQAVDGAYLVKLDSQRVTQWARYCVMGARAIATHDNGEIVLTGSFGGRWDVDPGPDSNYLVAHQRGLADVFVLTYSAQGQYLGASSLYSSGSEYSRQLATDSRRGIYVGGYYRNVFDVDPTRGTDNRTSAGDLDAFLIRYNLCTVHPVRMDSVQSCSTYTWVDGSTHSYSTHRNPPAYNYQDVNGCDSTVYLYLTLTPLSVTIAQANATLTATANYPNVTYQWIDANTQQPIVGATSATFAPSANGTYQVVVSNGTCTETSDPATVLHTGVFSLSETAFQCYPNPTRGRVTLHLGLPHRDVRVALYDPSSRCLAQQTYGTLAQMTYDLPTALPAGLYLLVVHTAEHAPQPFKVQKR